MIEIDLVVVGGRGGGVYSRAKRGKGLTCFDKVQPGCVGQFRNVRRFYMTTNTRDSISSGA